MRYIVTLFWAILLGQIVGFIGSNLTGGVYSFAPTAIVSIVVAIIVMLIVKITESN